MLYCSSSAAQGDPRAIITVNPSLHKEGNLQTASPALHQSVSIIPKTQAIVLQQPGNEMLRYKDTNEH